MLLSVVIPCRENDSTLSRCLQSLTGSGHDGDFEVVVVVDGTDSSLALSAISVLPPTILSSVISTGSHQGAAAARNMGVSAAHGRFVWFVDSDDVIDSSVLALFWNSLAATPIDISLIHLGAMRLPGDLSYSPSLQQPQVKAPADIMLPRSHCLDHTTYWISRSFLLQNPSLRYHQDMSILEDSLFVLSLLASCDSILCAYNCRPYIHIVGNHSLTSGTWRYDRASLFLPSIQSFFLSFKRMINNKVFHCVSVEQSDNIKALYHRYQYVYMRVLAVKGVESNLYNSFFYRHLVNEGFHPLNLKERLFFNLFFHQSLSLLCRTFRH